ncbi:hypothetical protein B0H11DRAFT_1930584 [Mycena galericulata]|nr:hypothetical protein B0H11DRAFT_1930584 [Mycena galericulata]
MSSPSPSPFSPAAFDANRVPVVGRSHREVHFTPGRLEHDRTRELNAQAGQKRAQTRANNLNLVAGIQPTPPPPLPRPQRPHGPSAAVTTESQPPTAAVPAVYRDTAHTLRMPPPQTARMPATPRMAPTPLRNASMIPTKTSNAPQGMLSQSTRTPLQPISNNAGIAYPDFSRAASVPLITQPAPSSSPQSGTMAWFTALSVEDEARLLDSINNGPLAPRDDSHLSGSDGSHRYEGSPDLTPPAMLSLPHDNDPEYPDGEGADQDVDDIQYTDDDWNRPADEEEFSNDHELAVSSLEFTSRMVEPSHPRKRQAQRQHVSSEGDEQNGKQGDQQDGGESEPQTPSPPEVRPKKKQKSRSISALPADHQSICARAYTYFKIDLTNKIPFPVAGRRAAKGGLMVDDDFSELILGALTNAAYDLDFKDAKPTREDIALVPPPAVQVGSEGHCTPFSAWRLRGTRHSYPVESDLGAHRGCCREEQKRVEVILKTYVYKDPDDITIPNTMFRNDIFQHVLNGYWFGKKDQNRASYFKDMTHLELVTLALIIVAVLCAIEEWTTGKWVEKEFSHKTYFQQYKKVLGGLRAWKAHSAQQVSEKGAPRNLTLDALEELLTNARSVATCPIQADEEEEEEDGMFSLSAFEANAA